MKTIASSARRLTCKSVMLPAIFNRLYELGIGVISIGIDNDVLFGRSYLLLTSHPVPDAVLCCLCASGFEITDN